MSLDQPIDEPTMIGDTPEDRARAAQRRKRLRIVAAVVVVILAVGIVVALIPTTPSKNFTVDFANSRCAAGGSLSCNVFLDPKPGYTATASLVKSVQINGTDTTTSTVKMAGSEIQIGASVPLVAESHCLPDIGCSQPPPTHAQITVFMTDGTTVSALLGVTNGE